MLTKIVGVFLLLAGVLLAFPLLGGLVIGAVTLALFLLKLVLVGGLILVGWRWISGGSVLAKIGGAFLLVAGIAMAFALFGSLVMGALGMVMVLLKVLLVVGLAYWGWCWINGRRPRWPGRAGS